ncbi:MAG: TlyA family RNA methyltransferase [Clostridia bacterium]|nr:TlyA family RNA methyltransferase [Clostridia bacterium]
MRLDVALTARGLAPSRSKAASWIEAGWVTVNGKCCKKSSVSVHMNDVIVVSQTQRFVSRGGEKLLRAIETFGIELTNRVCMDVGASTGGFTDCMLQFGAQTVYAVDVGTNQLDTALRSDPRVVNKEQFNFRYATPADFPTLMDFASVDVSFISLEKILPSLFSLLSNKGEAVLLIKPQFEAGKEHLGKNGIVRSSSVHCQVIERVMQYSVAIGFAVLGCTYSPIKGSHGNVEYLLYVKKTEQDTRLFTVEAVKQIVAQAHKELRD